MVSLLAIAGSLLQPINAPPADQLAQTTAELEKAERLGVSTIIDLEGSFGYSSNPQLGFDSSGQAFGRFSIYAARSRQTVRSSTVFSIFGENSIYTGSTGSTQLVRATASHQTAISERTSVFGNVTASLDRGGQLGNRFFGSPNAPVAVHPELIPVYTENPSDLYLVGGNTYRLSGQAGVNTSISLRDSLTFSAGADYVKFGGRQSSNDFTSVFGSAGWNRQLNERAGVGATIAVHHSDYSQGRSSRSINPQLTGHLQLAERLDLAVAAGVSFAQNKDGIDTQNSVGLTFNGSLCSRQKIESYCVRISRDNQADSFAGPSTSTAFDVNYSRRIDQNQSIQFSAGASRQSQRFDMSTQIAPIGNQTYLRAAASYSRNIGPRLLSGLNVSARSLRRAGDDPKPDLSASLFVRWRVGDLR